MASPNGFDNMDEDLQDSQRVLMIPTLEHEEVPLHLDDLSPEELDGAVDLLVAEQVEVKFWVRVIEEIWRLDRWREAMEVLDKGIAGALCRALCS